MRNFKIIILSILLFQKVYSQQDPEYTMYMFNMMSINPAYAGSMDNADVTLLFRKQWVSFPGAPQTISFNAHTPFFFEKMGAGLSVINDKLGVMDHNVVNLAYSYHVRLKKTILSFGMQGSYSQFSSNLSNIKINDPNSPQSADKTFDQNMTQKNIKGGGGIFLFGKKGYAGISTPRFADLSIGGTGTGSIVPYKSQPHIFFASGYIFDIGKEIKLKPSTVLKYTSGAPIEFDLNCNLYFLERFGIGASYRTFDSFDIILEYRINKNLRVLYSYDYTLTELGNYNSGSHEIILNWQCGFKKGKIITPRYF